MSQFIYENVMIIIKENGKIEKLPKIEDKEDFPALRLEDIIPGLLNNFNDDFTDIDSVSSYIASLGKIAIWESKSKKNTISIALPKKVDVPQLDTLVNLLPILADEEIYEIITYCDNEADKDRIGKISVENGYEKLENIISIYSNKLGEKNFYESKGIKSLMKK